MFQNSLRARDTRAVNLFNDLVHLRELDLDWSGSTEDADHDLEGLLVFVDLVHCSGEVGKRPFVNANLLALVELDLQCRLVLRYIRAEQDRADLLLGESDRIVARAEEARNPGRVLNDVPQVVVEIHLDQNVAREENALDGVLLAVAQLRHGLGRNHDPADLVLQTEGGDAALKRLAHLALKS